MALATSESALHPVGVSLLAIAVRHSTHVLNAETHREQAHFYRGFVVVIRDAVRRGMSVS